MSIVLVIIGLIVGGVLVGQDLIRAAYTRGQISQIERFNTAANTFYGKYQALPGDLGQSTAQAYGFASRLAWQGVAYAGMGDGNGIIEGVQGQGPNENQGWVEAAGETVMFWEDLTYANGLNLNLIPDTFRTAIPQAPLMQVGQPNITGTMVALYLPAAKLGAGNYVYVYSGGPNAAVSPDGKNYYGISAVTDIWNFWGSPYSTANIPVRTAYNIDSKIDDGMPQSGRVTTVFLDSRGNNPGGVNPWPRWVGGDYGPTDTSATPASATSCYDNGGNGSAPRTYSVGYNNGAGGNCALSFMFQ